LGKHHYGTHTRNEDREHRDVRVNKVLWPLSGNSGARVIPPVHPTTQTAARAALKKAGQRGKTPTGSKEITWKKSLMHLLFLEQVFINFRWVAGVVLTHAWHAFVEHLCIEYLCAPGCSKTWDAAVSQTQTLLPSGILARGDTVRKCKHCCPLGS
jgi:hypothetical protein